MKTRQAGDGEGNNACRTSLWHESVYTTLAFEVTSALPKTVDQMKKRLLQTEVTSPLIIKKPKNIYVQRQIACRLTSSHRTRDGEMGSTGRQRGGGGRRRDEDGGDDEDRSAWGRFTRSHAGCWPVGHLAGWAGPSGFSSKTTALEVVVGRRNSKPGLSLFDPVADSVWLHPLNLKM